MTTVIDALDRELQQAARDHLWLHFTRMGGYGDAEVPIIVRGDGCYLEDSNGQALPRRAGGPLRGADRLLVRRRGRRGGARADAGAALLHELVVRASARDRARARGGAARARRPEPRLLRLGRLGGGRVGLEARAPVLLGAARRAPLEGDRAAGTAYHGTTMGALSINGIAGDQERRSSRSCPRRSTSATRTATTGPPRRPRRSSPAFLLDDLEQTIIAAGPSTVAMVIMEPVQNAGGAFTPPAGYCQGVREICDRYEILLCADEVITGFGRLGDWFGSTKYDIRPDLVTSAKGLSSAYAAIGAVIATDRVFEPFLERAVDVHARDHVRRPPRACARSRSRTSRS